MKCQLHNHGHALLQIFLSMEVNHTSLWLIDFLSLSYFIRYLTTVVSALSLTFYKFLEFGVPDEIPSDRGTNFISQLFLSFCKGLDIKLSFSSAYHHSGNPAERAVCIIKNIMKKCAHTKTNWRLGLLEYLCTPLSEKLSSPAELLATCRYKGLQPTLCARLLPTVAESNKDELISHKEIEKANHDRSAHDLPIMPVGCTVTYFEHMSKTWLVGKIAQMYS